MIKDISFSVEPMANGGFLVAGNVKIKPPENPEKSEKKTYNGIFDIWSGSCSEDTETKQVKCYAQDSQHVGMVIQDMLDKITIAKLQKKENV